MSWSIGFDSRWNRDIGYGVPAICDFPGCNTEIDRGLSYVCGDAPYGGIFCGLFFCEDHKNYWRKDETGRLVRVCYRCSRNKRPFNRKPDVQEWIDHKETHESWAEWRKERDAPTQPSEEEQR